MFVLLALGVPLIVIAAKFARNAIAHGLSLVRALTVAIDVRDALGRDIGSRVGRQARRRQRASGSRTRCRYLLEGFGESMTPAILAGSLAAIAWILVAFGVRRMPRDPNSQQGAVVMIRAIALAFSLSTVVFAAAGCEVHDAAASPPATPHQADSARAR